MKFSLTLNSLYKEKAVINEESYGIESLIDANLLSLDMFEYKACVESIHMDINVSKEFDIGTEALTVKGKLVKFWYKILDIVEKLFGYVSAGFKFLLKKFGKLKDYSSANLSNAPIRAYHALINELFKKDEFESEEDAVDFASNLISKSKILSKLKQEYKDMILEDIRSNYDSSSNKMKEEYEGRVEIYYPDENLRKSIKGDSVSEDNRKSIDYTQWSRSTTSALKDIKETNPYLMRDWVIKDFCLKYTNRLIYISYALLNIKDIPYVEPANRFQPQTNESLKENVERIFDALDKLNTELDKSDNSEYTMVKEIVKFKFYRDGIVDSDWSINDSKLSFTSTAGVIKWINREFSDIVKLAEDIHEGMKDLKRKWSIDKHDTDLNYDKNKYESVTETFKNTTKISNKLVSISKKVFNKISGDLLKKLSISGLTINYILTYDK